MSETAASSEAAARAALIAAMAESCVERGYIDTTIEDLLAATGLRRSDFDRHFAGKEACAVAAVDEALAAGLATVTAGFSGDRPEGESVLQVLLGLLELFAERPALGSLAMTDARQRLPRAAFERYAGGFAILIATLDRLRADGAPGAMAPPNAARGGIGGSEALIRRELARGRAAELPRLLPDLIYSAAVPFLGQKEALRLSRQGAELLKGKRGE
ncbi:MAG TPA: hypothetical protein VLL27_08795 [Solirubrobacterales bacterium]|nr:hypothetical protein [Solirubrobacterales bacterium]